MTGFARIFGATRWALVCVLLVGCAGLQRDRVYRPVAPTMKADHTQPQREPDASWPIVLSGAELNVQEVVYASKLIWVFGPFFAFPTFWEKYVSQVGPLEIGVLVAADPGASVGFDLQEFIVVLEDGRSFPPAAAAPFGTSEFEPTGPVMLSGGQTWRGRLQYDLSRMDLVPFELRLGTLDVNGQAIRLPPIPFIPGKSFSGS